MALIAGQSINRALTLVEGSTALIRFVPLDPTGAVLDCTGYDTSGELNIFSDTGVSFALQTIAAIPQFADATGISFAATPAWATALRNSLGVNRGVYTLTASNGTDSINVASGAIQVQLNKLPSV